MNPLDRQRLTDPRHPGLVVREYLDAMGIGPTAAATRLGLASRASFAHILAGRKPLTIRMAWQIEGVFGLSAYALMRLQMEHDFAAEGK